ncbi:MAG: hypothetical protein R2717_03885 [Schumannella sp.]
MNPDSSTRTVQDEVESTAATRATGTIASHHIPLAAIPNVIAPVASTMLPTSATMTAPGNRVRPIHTTRSPGATATGATGPAVADRPWIARGMTNHPTAASASPARAPMPSMAAMCGCSASGRSWMPTVAVNAKLR